jgi:hypothetical protein
MYTLRRARPLAAMVRIIYLVPAALVHLVVYVGRWLGRWYVTNRAENWPATDARVTGSYELDENQSILSPNGWEIDDDDDDEYEYHPRFAVAIQYSYRVDGEVRVGTYFLPETYTEGDLASEAERSWAGRKILVRYNPTKPSQSFFLICDGAPGQPHIPRLLSQRPYITDLSLR